MLDLAQIVRIEEVTHVHLQSVVSLFGVVYFVLILYRRERETSIRNLIEVLIEFLI